MFISDDDDARLETHDLREAMTTAMDEQYEEQLLIYRDRCRRAHERAEVLVDIAFRNEEFKNDQR